MSVINENFRACLQRATSLDKKKEVKTDCTRWFKIIGKQGTGLPLRLFLRRATSNIFLVYDITI